MVLNVGSNRLNGGSNEGTWGTPRAFAVVKPTPRPKYNCPVYSSSHTRHQIPTVQLKIKRNLDLGPTSGPLEARRATTRCDGVRASPPFIVSSSDWDDLRRPRCLS